MKQLIIFLLPVVIFASCVKDRIPPAPQQVITSANDTIMYFWSFNNQDSSNRAPDFGVNAGAIFNYDCSYIDYTTGSSLNLLPGVDSGECLRARNPSNYLIFNMPTTGYDSIVLKFAEEASSSSAPINNLIYYTVDGVNYISTALDANSGSHAYTVNTSFTLNSFNFSSDTSTNNNPKFAIKIIFNGNNTGTTGNDRFDNVSLQGVRR